jgi:hypothetical protein
MSQRDLYVVVADLDAENAVRSLLCERQVALGICLRFNPDRPPLGDLLRYSGRDSGCYKDAVDLLRPQRQTHRHALLIFDRHGCGVETKSREEIENDVERRLCENGWAREAVCVVVIEPELEAWVWSASPHVANVLGWQDNYSALQSFLIASRLWEEGGLKPTLPKEAMECALREKNKPFGAPLFSELAKRVGLGRCEDPAFKKFYNQLRQWFPLQSDPQFSAVRNSV